MRRRAVAIACMFVAACSIGTDDDKPDAQRVSICEPLAFEDSPFTHCVAEPGEHTIDMDLAAEGEDAPYRSVIAYADAAGEDTGDLALVMNGGMFDADGQPIGYYVESGRRQTVLNQNAGPGNFHLLPNGVFFGETAQGPWHVWATPRFAADIENRPYFATQSGPMLVIDGELHPDIDPDGDSRRIRNAVGIDDAGRAHFLISQAPVSFGKLARLYRDVLNIDNALFLDGSVSQMWDPASDRLDRGPQIGPLIVVSRRETDQ